MTGENRRAAIADEMAHGAAALRAARLLRDNQLWNDALSRLYYDLSLAVQLTITSMGDCGGGAVSTGGVVLGRPCARGRRRSQ